MDVPTEELVSKEYAAKLRERMSHPHTGESPSTALGNGTTYLCAVDAEGNGAPS